MGKPPLGRHSRARPYVRLLSGYLHRDQVLRNALIANATEWASRVCANQPDLIMGVSTSCRIVGRFSISGIRLTWPDPLGCRYAILDRCGWGWQAVRYWVWSSWPCLLLAPFGRDGTAGATSAARGSAGVDRGRPGGAVGIGLKDVYSMARSATVSRGGGGPERVPHRVSRPALGGRNRAGTVVWTAARSCPPRRRSCRMGDAPLLPDATYRWRVQTWDGRESAGRWRGSRHSTLAWTTPTGTRTGSSDTVEVLDTPETFNVQNTPASGPTRTNTATSGRRRSWAALLSSGPRAYVSADQQYELHVNGSMAAKGEAYAYPDSQYYENDRITHSQGGKGQRLRESSYDWQGPGKGRPGGHAGRHRPHNRTARRRHGRRDHHDGTWKFCRVRAAGVQRDERATRSTISENINGPAEPIAGTRPVIGPWGGSRQW